VTMTIKVYRLTSDGQRHVVSEETTEGVPLPVVAQGYPPCSCPRCKARMSPAERKRLAS